MGAPVEEVLLGQLGEEATLKMIMSRTLKNRQQYYVVPDPDDEKSQKLLVGQLGEEADGQEEDHNGHIGSCGGYGLRQPGCLATSVRQEEVLLGQLCEEGEGQEEAGALASTPNPSSVQPSALRWRRGSGKH
jgi:hypothetical protein